MRRRGAEALALLLLCSACGGEEEAQQPVPSERSGQAQSDAGVELGWVRQYGIDKGQQSIRGISSEPAGSFVVSGTSINGTFGGSRVSGESDFVLARYDAEGAHLWTRSFPRDPESFEGPSVGPVVLSPAGDSFTAGSYSGALDLGGRPLRAARKGERTFLARFDAAGRHVWSRSLAASPLSGSAELNVSRLALDPEGNLVAGGSFRGVVDFGSGQRLRGDGTGALRPFIARFRPNGTTLSATALEEMDADFPGAGINTLAADPAGHVAFAGTFRASEDPEAFLFAAFVGRLSPAGELQWVKRFEGELPGAGDAQFINSIETGADGTVYFAGEFSARVRFAGQEVASRPPYFAGTGAGPDLLLGAFGADGTELWVRELPGLGEGVATQVRVDERGQLLVRGRLITSGDLGTGVLPPASFIAGYSASGAPRWVNTYDPNLDEVYGFVLQPGGRLVQSARLSVSVEVGGELLVRRGFNDLLFVQLIVPGGGGP